MYHLCKEIHFCYGHRLMDYPGACGHLHGHNGKVEIHLKKKTLDSRHILHEFGDLKDKIKRWIDKTLDHKMLLRKDDPLAKVLSEMGEPVFLMETNPTAEGIAKLIFDYGLNQNLPVEKVVVWETPSAFACYDLSNS